MLMQFSILSFVLVGFRIYATLFAALRRTSLALCRRQPVARIPLFSMSDKKKNTYQEQYPNLTRLLSAPSSPFPAILFLKRG